MWKSCQTEDVSVNTWKPGCSGLNKYCQKIKQCLVTLPSMCGIHFFKDYSSHMIGQILLIFDEDDTHGFLHFLSLSLFQSWLHGLWSLLPFQCSSFWWLPVRSLQYMTVVFMSRWIRIQITANPHIILRELAGKVAYHLEQLGLSRILK